MPGLAQGLWTPLLKLSAEAAPKAEATQGSWEQSPVLGFRASVRRGSGL